MVRMNYRKLLGRIKECGYTQGSLAAAIGVNASHFSGKVNGNFPFRQEEIFRICTVLEIPRDEVGVYFFTPDVEKSQQ